MPRDTLSPLWNCPLPKALKLPSPPKPNPPIKISNPPIKISNPFPNPPKPYPYKPSPYRIPNKIPNRIPNSYKLSPYKPSRIPSRDRSHPSRDSRAFCRCRAYPPCPPSPPSLPQCPPIWAILLLPPLLFSRLKKIPPLLEFRSHELAFYPPSPKLPGDLSPLPMWVPRFHLPAFHKSPRILPLHKCVFPPFPRSPHRISPLPAIPCARLFRTKRTRRLPRFQTLF